MGRTLQNTMINLGLQNACDEAVYQVSIPRGVRTWTGRDPCVPAPGNVDGLVHWLQGMTLGRKAAPEPAPKKPGCCALGSAAGSLEGSWWFCG